MFEASDRKPTHVGLRWKPPLMDGIDDGPLAGAALRGREVGAVGGGAPGGRGVRRPPRGEPLLPMLPPRSRAKTSWTPFRSPRTMLLARDSKAIARAKRLSFEMTGCVDGPFGIFPL